MKKRVCLLLACTALVTLTVGFLAGAGPSRGRGQTRRRPGQQTQGGRGSDPQDVRGADRALEKGDAKGLAALWTDEGEYVGGDGTTLRGRAAVEAAYAKFFAKAPNLKADVTIDGIRFLGHDSAVEEGIAQGAQGQGPGAGHQPLQHPVRPGGRPLEDRPAPRVARRGGDAARPRLAGRHLDGEDRRRRGAHHLRMGREQDVPPRPHHHQGRRPQRQRLRSGSARTRGRAGCARGCSAATAASARRRGRATASAGCWNRAASRRTAAR